MARIWGGVHLMYETKQREWEKGNRFGRSSVHFVELLYTYTYNRIKARVRAKVNAAFSAIFYRWRSMNRKMTFSTVFFSSFIEWWCRPSKRTDFFFFIFLTLPSLSAITMAWIKGADLFSNLFVVNAFHLCFRYLLPVLSLMWFFIVGFFSSLPHFLSLLFFSDWALTFISLLNFQLTNMSLQLRSIIFNPWIIDGDKVALVKIIRFFCAVQLCCVQ